MLVLCTTTVFLCCFVLLSFVVFCLVVCLFCCLLLFCLFYFLFVCLFVNVCSLFFFHMMHVNSACCKTSILIN